MEKENELIIEFIFHEFNQINDPYIKEKGQSIILNTKRYLENRQSYNIILNMVTKDSEYDLIKLSNEEIKVKNIILKKLCDFFVNFFDDGNNNLLLICEDTIFFLSNYVSNISRLEKECPKVHILSQAKYNNYI